MNFKNLIIELHVLIISFILENFQKNQKSTAMSSKNIKSSSFCDLKLCIKNNFIDQIVNNNQFEQNLICMLRT